RSRRVITRSRTWVTALTPSAWFLGTMTPFLARVDCAYPNEARRLGSTFDVDVLVDAVVVDLAHLVVLDVGADRGDADRRPEGDHRGIRQHLLRRLEVEGGALGVVGRLECLVNKVLVLLVLVAAEAPRVLGDQANHVRLGEGEAHEVEVVGV